QTCTGVARYYNNDGGGVGIPAGTPLESVREELEETWKARFEDDEEDEDDEGDRDEFEGRLRRLRAPLMAFETGDRPEEGEAYSDAYGPRHDAGGHGTRRLMTLDGGGALLPDGTTVSRPVQRNWGDYDWCGTTSAALVESAEAVDAMVEDARRRC